MNFLSCVVCTVVLVGVIVGTREWGFDGVHSCRSVVASYSGLSCHGVASDDVDPVTTERDTSSFDSFVEIGVLGGVVVFRIVKTQLKADAILHLRRQALPEFLVKVHLRDPVLLDKPSRDWKEVASKLHKFCFCTDF